MGLPGTVVNFDDLNSVGDTTSSRWGAMLRRSSFVYPPETMNKQAYAAALSRAIDNLTRPLTPEEKAVGIMQPKPRPEVFISGDFDQIQKSYYDAGMTDGLPIIPPTAERVSARHCQLNHR